MERITSEQLLSKKNIANLEQGIKTAKEKAQEVFKLREQNVNTVRDYSDKISEWATSISDAIDTVEVKVGKDSFHENESVSAAIIEKGQKIKEEIQRFKDLLDDLEIRFGKKKIKVVSVGRSGTGKSSFTRFWTGLGEDVIRTHPDGNNLDCTGALCNFYYDSHVGNNHFRAVVHFISAKDLIGRVDSLFQQICCHDDVDSSCGGRIEFDHFTSLEQIRTLIGNGFYCPDPEKAINGKAYVNIDGCWGPGDNEIKSEIKMAFAAYFKDDTYLDIFNNISAEKTPKDVQDVTTAEELDKYNWMQHPKACYLAVRSIDLFVNPSEQKGLLEFFEIADTKGISDTTLANDEVLEAITDSDAVFSVHLEHTADPNRSFYKETLRTYKNNGHKELPRKHFIVFNKEIGLDQVSANSGISVIRGTGTSNCLYEGCLKAVNNDDQTPQKFSVAVVIDMLEKIASQVNELDTERAKKCNVFITNIQTLVEEYRNLLNALVLKPNFNDESYVEDTVRHISNIIADFARDKMEELAFNPKNDKTLTDPQLQEEYKRARQEQSERAKEGERPNDGYVKYISPYQVISGIEPENANDMDNTDAAMDILFDDVIKEIDLQPKKFPKNDRDFVVYINHVIGRILARFTLRKFDATIQGCIDIRREKKELFDKIWEITSISKELQNDPSEYVANIRKIRDDDSSESLTVFPSMFKHYSILKNYFVQAKPLDFKEQNGQDLIEYETLRNVLKQQVRELQLMAHLARKYVERKRALYKMYSNVEEFFNGIVYPPLDKSCHQFYLSHLYLLTNSDPTFASKENQAKDDRIIQDNKEIVNKIFTDSINQLQPLVLQANVVSSIK
jgi:hypothetical protein